MRKIDLIVIHYSTTHENTDHSPEQLGSDHEAWRFFRADYNFYIYKSGEMMNLRPLERILTHVRGHNKHNIGICYEGGLDITGQSRDTHVQAQKTSLLRLIRHPLICFPGSWVCGHRDLSGNLSGDGTTPPDERVKQYPSSDAISEYKELVYELRRK